ncbi:helix-turn-helix transcriptional regulator [Arthrobacter cavernae]|uniref:Transcriptional regulator n=1 Tax=Arthrobacter cavernae TaxID=2817681 RepID=A0A939HBN6_9MICC|nr:helix-turn-helix domain-containing protein [Arthrobacter cavernae]MBO1266811.1 transcriptional regulator [Arthrobacter cavernae]
MTALPWLRRISAVASLDDGNRRELYEYVCNAPDAVGRDKAAQIIGVPRSTASFHLDRLVRDGLLDVEFRKSTDKSGPGSGRPAKLYRPAVAEVGASVPERQYDLAGELMAAAIARSISEGGPVREALVETAYERGKATGRDGEFLAVLADHGYVPTPDGDGGYRLLNCPFHRLAEGHSEVVCAMNGAFLSGTAAACGLPEESVEADSGPGHCCARITSLDS